MKVYLCNSGFFIEKYKITVEPVIENGKLLEWSACGSGDWKYAPDFVGAVQAVVDWEESCCVEAENENLTVQERQ